MTAENVVGSSRAPGGVRDPVSKGFDPSLDRCIEGRVPTWRFPIPTLPDGTATTAGFSFRFKLIPE